MRSAFSNAGLTSSKLPVIPVDRISHLGLQRGTPLPDLLVSPVSEVPSESSIDSSDHKPSTSADHITQNPTDLLALSAGSLSPPVASQAAASDDDGSQTVEEESDGEIEGDSFSLERTNSGQSGGIRIINLSEDSENALNQRSAKGRATEAGSGSKVMDVRINGWGMVGGKTAKSGSTASRQGEADTAKMGAYIGEHCRSLQIGLDAYTRFTMSVYKCEFVLAQGTKLHRLLRYTDFETFRRLLKRNAPVRPSSCGYEMHPSD